MTKKQRTLLAVELLEKTFPDAVCSLDYTTPLELLIATLLSAQCTDARVNIVTKDLFAHFRTAEDYANASLSEIENDIKSCGLYKTKAKNINALGKMLVSDFGGEVPDNLEDLTKLPGVGRKTANLIMGDIYGQPSYVCDTHCIRITNLIGLTDSTNPLQVEKQLRKILPPEKSGDFCHRMVLHGRAFCKARTPDCVACPIKNCCKHWEKQQPKTKNVKNHAEKDA